jgi:hypothetical protein
MALPSCVQVASPVVLEKNRNKTHCALTRNIPSRRLDDSGSKADNRAT